MDKMKMETPDLVAGNIEKIGEIFPNCITEDVGEDGKLRKAINFDILRQMLSDEVVQGDEAYEFTWVGKRAAIVEANKPIRKTLRPCPEESVDWENTENLYIEGDNLEVLKLLQESYLGKVKIIYVDPPYNTGNDFIYRDDFAMTSYDYSEESGQIDEEGNRLFKNTDSNGKFHSDWCSMIYSRLMIARNLLRDDGVIFISIDDNEIENLRKICDEIYGTESFVAQLSIIVKTEGRQYGSFAKTHEYCLVYAKSISKLATNEIKIENGKFKYYDSKGGFNIIGLRNRAVRIFNSSNRPNLRYPFYVDIDHVDNNGFSKVSTEPIHGWVKVLPSVVDGLESVWRWGKETAKKNKDELVALKGKDNEIRIFKKDRDLTTLPKTVWFEKEFNSIVGTREVANIVGKGLFDFPKPLSLIKRVIEIGASDDSIILDFFSGSATTAHAVMQLNAEDGGNRKFIMVQLPEETDEKSEAYKAGYKNICEIGKERIRRAGKNILEDAMNETVDIAQYGESWEVDKIADKYKKLDVGFRVFKLDDTNMKDVYYGAAEYSQLTLDQFESNIKEDRTDMDLLFGCLLDWGVTLSQKHSIEEINGCRVHTYGNGAIIDLMACFDNNIPEDVIKTIAKKQPLRVVFRDSSFADSPAKINVTEIFKLLSPDTVVKVI